MVQNFSKLFRKCSISQNGQTYLMRKFPFITSFVFLNFYTIELTETMPNVDVHFSLQQQFASLAIVSPSNLKWKPRKQMQTIIISLLILLLDQSLKNIRLIQFRTADIYQEREERPLRNSLNSPVLLIFIIPSLLIHKICPLPKTSIIYIRPMSLERSSHSTLTNLDLTVICGRILLAPRCHI